ncbi:MAG: SDR family NAD(P)-dependent oxidoreductase [Acidovorax sp.]
MQKAHIAQPEEDGLEIAVIGMAGRFPGAADIDTFWKNIRDGVESVVSYSDEQLREMGVPEEVLADPDYVKAGVAFDGADQFDAGLFGYAPREAEQLDPQHRVFLEVAWTALEHAGYDTRRFAGSTAVFAGTGVGVYLMKHLLPHVDLSGGGNIADLLGLVSGNAAESLSTRVAYKLNLRGPAVTVQTACSTSLTAVHLASQSLLSNDCDMAIAGGVSLNLLQTGGYRYQAGAIFSPDGHCRAFDADAAGTLLGSGAGVVVLRRLEDARRDGDCIHAVIKATAANNDGSDKIGFTAPSVSGQAAVIRAAHMLSGIPADSIGYVETHGTGTALGDPVEVAALTQAFRAGTQRRGFCAIGSVKTNVGHLDCAAGVAGLIKTVFALKHQTLPASLHFRKPNPKIDFEASPFYVNATTKPWPSEGVPRRAGVSSFGIGGTNVHVVLEEAPAEPLDTPSDGWHVLPVSAASSQALRASAARLAEHLAGSPETSLADVAHTLQNGRCALGYRGAVAVCQSTDAVHSLRALAQIEPIPVPTAAAEVVFLFPGGGSQHANMGVALYARYSAFREEVERCCGILMRDAALDLREHLFPPEGLEAEANEALSQIALAQPALFTVSYAMARLWETLGVRPALMLGHSLGEYVAACLAGVFSLEDALRVVAARGRLLQTLAPGAMTSIMLPEEMLRPFLVEGCDVAAVNGESHCVFAGPLEKVAAVERALREAMHVPRRLHVSIASHSAMTEPVMAQLESIVAAVPRREPRIPFISCVTGRLITPEQSTSPRYWAQHLRCAVRFGDGIREALSSAGRVLLEVGPGESLASLARQHPLRGDAAAILASQAHVQQQTYNDQRFTHAVGQLWSAGVEIDWTASRRGATPRRVALPTYPFDHQRYWIEPSPDARPPGTSLRRASRPVSEWFYAPSWKRVEAAAEPAPPTDVGCALIYADAGGFAERLSEKLRAAGRKVIVAEPGGSFARLSPDRYVLSPDSRAEHAQLIEAITAEEGPVRTAYHLWCLGEAQEREPSGGPDDVLRRGFHSLMALAPVLADHTNGDAKKFSLTVVVDQMADVTGQERLCPYKALVYGPCRVMGLEYPQIQCRLIDIEPPIPGAACEQQLAGAIAAECHSGPCRTMVAYRGAYRWIKTYEAAARQTSTSHGLRDGGVYLITGGLSGIGLVLAKQLARRCKARLVLVSRRGAPPADAWAGRIEATRATDDARHLLSQLEEIESLGSEVLIEQADVSDRAAIRRVVESAHKAFGRINGVIHAAGLPGGGAIEGRARQDIETVFAPKVTGTLAVLDAVDDDRPDFIVLCSSLTAVVGAYGQADYCAANCFLDALAWSKSREQGSSIISVNWDTWRDVGIAAKHSLPDGFGIRPDQGAEVFDRLISARQPGQIVVSTVDLSEQFDGAESTEFADRLMRKAVKTGSKGPRPAIRTAFVQPSGDLETGLVEIWSELLGIAPIGIEDNLFELGGDSLLAIQSIARVRQRYGVEIHPAALFKDPTVSALAVLVETKLIDEIQASPSAESIADRQSTTV